jgi:hypothetical protein
MAVNLICPNCGATIGYADSSDNYIHKYYHKNDNNEPICNNCGSGIFNNYERNIFIGALIAILLIIVICIIFC